MVDNKFMKELFELAKGNVVKDVVSSLKSEKSSIIKLNKELDRKMSDITQKNLATEDLQEVKPVEEKVKEPVSDEEKTEEIKEVPASEKQEVKAEKEETVVEIQAKSEESSKKVEVKEAVEAPKTETKTINTKVGVVVVKTESNGNAPARERRFLQRPVEEPKKKEYRPNNNESDKTQTSVLAEIDL